MIVKFLKPEGWLVIGDVTRIESQIDKGILGSNVEVIEMPKTDEIKTKPILVMMLLKNEEYYRYIKTDGAVFLLNDNGKTIDRF